MIIGVTGTNGAGKGVVVDYLKSKGFAHYSVRDTLVSMLTAEGVPTDRTALRNRANALRREYGAGYFGKRFLDDIHARNIEHAVIDSVRTTGEARFLKEHGALLLAIDADRLIRYNRIRERKASTDMVDFDTFVVEEEREWHGAEGTHDMNLRAVMKMADYTITNEGALVELHRKVDEILQTLK